MGVMDGNIVSFTQLLEEVWGQEDVDNGVKKRGGEHSLIALTVEVVRSKVVEPQNL